MTNREFQNKKNELYQSFLNKNINSHEFLHKHTALADELLIKLFEEIKANEELTLIALGGYGRGELYPYSDVDILILHSQTSINSEIISPFVQKLWDIGLKVGHAVRNLVECKEQIHADIYTQTAILESRFLAGSIELYLKLQNLSFNELQLKDFIHAKLLEQTQRHHRFHNIDSSLEPNIKESPGGLREIHLLSFINSAINLKNNFDQVVKNSRPINFVAQWQEKKWLSDDEINELIHCQNFLQNLRIHLHLICKRGNDKLLFDYQEVLAEVLGYKNTNQNDDIHLRPAEQLMKAYYKVAMQNLQLNKLLTSSISELSILNTSQIPPQSTKVHKGLQKLGFGLGINSENVLEVIDQDEFTNSPENILKPYLWQNQSIVSEISVAVKRLISSISNNINNHRFHPTLQHDFIELIKLPRGVITTLRELNRMGFLGGYIKAFGNIVGQMQYDLYHAYTVDQHILMVIRNLRRYMLVEFNHEYPEHSRVMAQFPKAWVLIIAALFHDIAKGRTGDHSNLGMGDALEFCQLHKLEKDDTDLIVWLVREHLNMSRIAQSSDVSDVKVIQKFCEKLGGVASVRRLQALYLLTVADIRGTAPAVWTPWKDKLLTTLYQSALSYLGNNVVDKLQQNQINYQETIHYLFLELQKLGWQEDNIKAQLQGLTKEYLAGFNIETMLWHLNAVLQQSLKQLEKILALREFSENNQPSGYFQLMIIAPVDNEQDLFGKTCGHLSHLRFSVMNAQSLIFREGANYQQKIFQFQIENTNSEVEITYAFINNLQSELQKRLENNNWPSPIFTRTPRHLRHAMFKPQARIMMDTSVNNYIVSISTADRLGLLYDLTRHFAKFQANILFARINTLGARAENSFLINCPQLKNTNVLFDFEKELIENLAIKQ